MTARDRLPDLDPRRDLARLPDGAPITMLPVRLETRFADAGAPQAPRPQLWVRIYPTTSASTRSSRSCPTPRWRPRRATGDRRSRPAATRPLSGRPGAAWSRRRLRPRRLRAGHLRADQPARPAGEGHPGVPARPAAETALLVPGAASVRVPRALRRPRLPRRPAGAAGDRRPGQLPLYVGPDPSADPADSIHPDGDLWCPISWGGWSTSTPPWRPGMALAIDLDRRAGPRRVRPAAGAGGADRRQRADGARPRWSSCSHHHRVGRTGLSLVPQGTPTHNTTGTGTGYTALDDADESFDDRTNQPLFTPTADGGASATASGSPRPSASAHSLLTTVHAAGGQDQMQARAMQRALWPATLGYWMDKMMTPVFGDDDRRPPAGILHQLRQRPRPACRRCGSAASRMASCRPPRSPGSAG